jgi:hypothetical protein
MANPSLAAYKYRRGRTEKGGVENQRQLLGVGIFGEGKSDQQKKKEKGGVENQRQLLGVGIFGEGLRLCTEKKTTFLTSHHFCSLSFETASTAGATPAPPPSPALPTPPSFFLSLLPSSSPASFAATL